MHTSQPNGVGFGRVICTSQCKRRERVTISKEVMKGPCKFLPALLPSPHWLDNIMLTSDMLLQTRFLNEMACGTNENLTHSLEESGCSQSIELWEINIYYCKPLSFGECWIHSIIAEIACKHSNWYWDDVHWQSKNLKYVSFGIGAEGKATRKLLFQTRQTVTYYLWANIWHSCYFWSNSEGRKCN